MPNYSEADFYAALGQIQAQQQAQLALAPAAPPQAGGISMKSVLLFGGGLLGVAGLTAWLVWRSEKKPRLGVLDRKSKAFDLEQQVIALRREADAEDRLARLLDDQADFLADERAQREALEEERVRAEDKLERARRHGNKDDESLAAWRIEEADRNLKSLPTTTIGAKERAMALRSKASKKREAAGKLNTKAATLEADVDGLSK